MSSDLSQKLIDANVNASNNLSQQTPQVEEVAPGSFDSEDVGERRHRESLGGQEDRASFIRESSLKAIQATKEPIKVTWSNLSYIVNVHTTKEEQKTSGNKTKPLQVLKYCSGYALPG